MKIEINLFRKNNVPSQIIELLSKTHKLIIPNNIDFFNWVNDNITIIMTKRECVQYAIYATELVIPNFEKEYPSDNRPREAIELTKKWLKDPSDENLISAASHAANNAYWSTVSNVAFSARSASNAARSAAFAAATPVHTIEVGDGYYVGYATSASASAKHATFSSKLEVSEMENKIMEYGLKLLLECE